jgi:threonylcarbamoyladenosine tRNA methylthiotransferase MtaB
LAGKVKELKIKVALETLGCKLNTAETEKITRQLSAKGYSIVENPADADVYILNTCTITHTADRKSRHLLRTARRRSPKAFIIALGCYADYTAQKLSSMKEVDLVLGNEYKNSMAEVLKNAGFSSNIKENPARNNFSERTRSFVKAQDGCNNFCTYCIVPYVRGREKSLPVKEVVSEVKARVADGYREVVITGTEIGRYRYEQKGLKNLIQSVLDETAVERLRLSSLQPREITPELISLWQNKRLCPHFHISLQSGSDTVLSRMNRRYRTEDFASTIEMLRDSIEDVSITTDVIVGFPGETDKEFEQGCEFCRRIGFSRIHVFTYSPRSGTAAAEMPDQVDVRIRKDRSREMLHLAKSSLESFNRSFLGRTLDVLFEQRVGEDWSGLTGNYIRVYAAGSSNLNNQILPVKLVDTSDDGLRGELSV